MKKLPEYFSGRGEVFGIEFSQIKRIGNLAIYQRSDGFFEVVTIQTQKASTATFDGRLVQFEEKEVYPSGESWNGSCVSTKEHAYRIFNRELLKNSIEERLKSE